MTSDLAQDLMDDIISLMCSTRPYVRKRATLVSYKLFLHYPDALRAAMPRLKEKLEDKGKETWKVFKFLKICQKKTLKNFVQKNAKKNLYKKNVKKIFKNFFYKKNAKKSLKIFLQKKRQKFFYKKNGKKIFNCKKNLF